MAVEFENWKKEDDLLAATLEMKDDFFWQSHTLSHQARDNLGEVDCESEDGGTIPQQMMRYSMQPRQHTHSDRNRRQPPT